LIMKKDNEKKCPPNAGKHLFGRFKGCLGILIN
jgi:hypothetical protein